jgi:glycine cleavage system H lipoate-binding protein
MQMATSSIFDSVKITDKESAKRLVGAIESSRKSAPVQEPVQCKVVELDDKGIRELFERK